MVKNPPANARDVRDTGLVPGLGRAPGGDMAAHSSILPWRIQSRGQRSLAGYSLRVTESWTQLEQLGMLAD